MRGVLLALPVLGIPRNTTRIDRKAVKVHICRHFVRVMIDYSSPASRAIPTTTSSLSTASLSIARLIDRVESALCGCFGLRLTIAVDAVDVFTGLLEGSSCARLRASGTTPTVRSMTDRNAEVSSKYAFGDTDLAAARLATVAEVFAPTSRSFLSNFAQRSFDLALDLGCGTGRTTHLVAEVLRPGRMVGMDRSESFLSLARPSAIDSIYFVQHDVTAVPFPTGAADLIYCRFLLSHLPRPQDQAAKWSAQLRSGGILLLDEVEWIRTTDPVFGLYLKIVVAMLERQGNKLYVGPLLGAMPDPAGLRRRFSRLATLLPASRQVAKMFLMNLQVWRDEPFVREAYGEETLSNLESDLARLAESGSSGEITWGLRQLAYQRV